MRISISTLLIVLTLSAAATAVHAVQGRDYVEKERQIVKMTKQMARESEEVKAFNELLEDLDAADRDESTQEFWQTARTVKEAMESEFLQGRERLQKEAASNPVKPATPVEPAVQEAEMLAATPLDANRETGAVETPLSKRVYRMGMIILETDGLRNPLSMNDETVIPRYRHLVGEFRDLLQADVDAMKADIETLKEEQRAVAD